MSSKLPIVGVALLLLLSVGAANVVITAERTALNDEYVTETLESEGFYESATTEIQDTVQSEIESFAPEESAQVPQGVDFSVLDAQALAEQSVPESYIRSQTNENIGRLFAYLHGDRSDLELRIDTEPLQSNVADAVSGQVSDVDPTALLDGSSVEVADSGYEVDGSLAQQMYEDESRFQQIQADFQTRYGDRSDEIASDAKTQARQQTQEATAQFNDQITQGTITIQEAVIDGITDPEMTHEQYRSEYESGQSQIADGAGQAAAAEIEDRIGDEVSTGELLNSEAESSLADARGYVQTMDTLQFVLPIVSLLLIALLYGITRAWQPTANATGKALVMVGVFALVVVLVQSALLGVIEDRVASQVEGNEVVGMDLVTSFVEGIFETLAVQSVLLVVLGLVLVGLAYADGKGYLDGIKESLGVTPTGAGGPAGQTAAQSNQQPPRSQQPPQEQHDPQPRQPTGRSVAREGPQAHEPHGGQPESGPAQPQDSESGGPTEPQDSESGGPTEPQDSESGDATEPADGESGDTTQSQDSESDSATEPQDSESDSATESGEGAPPDASQSGGRSSEQAQSTPADESGTETESDTDSTESASGSMDAWETGTDDSPSEDNE